MAGSPRSNCRTDLLDDLWTAGVAGAPRVACVGRKPAPASWRRIAQLRARIEEGGLREAAIRSLVYIGLAGRGVDERAFEVLHRIRAGQGQGLTLQEFKALLREQFFALLLDQKSALAAVPKMLPEDPVTRNDTLEKIRRVVSVVGKPEGVRAQRLAEIEQLFGTTVDEGAAQKKRISLV